MTTYSGGRVTINNLELHVAITQQQYGRAELDEAAKGYTSLLD
jgi:hypothetical protein